MSCCISESYIPSSTFWLVAIFLFLFVIFIADILKKLEDKTKQESESYKRDLEISNKILTSLRDDMFRINNKINTMDRTIPVKKAVKNEESDEDSE